MKRRFWIYPLIVLVLFFVIYPLCTKIFDNSAKRYNVEKEVELHDRIVDIVVDSVNKSTKFLVFKDKARYRPVFTYGLWIEASIGDSIVKKRGSLMYFFYRDASSSRVDTITYLVDTLTWKYVTIKSWSK